MTRELSLVLVGSGILTAGYFLYPEEDLEAKQQEQVAQQVAGNHHQTHRSHGYIPFLFIHTGAFSSRGGGGYSRPVAMGGSVSRGGFGSIGPRVRGRMSETEKAFLAKFAKRQSSPRVLTGR